MATYNRFDLEAIRNRFTQFLIAEKTTAPLGMPVSIGGADGARTRDPRRDRPVF
jgi:hypothetical protein